MPHGVRSATQASSRKLRIASAYCNDVAVGGPYPQEAGADVAALITYLNINLGAYGTWSAAFPGTIVLTGTTCATLDVVIQQGAI